MAGPEELCQSSYPLSVFLEAVASNIGDRLWEWLAESSACGDTGYKGHGDGYQFDCIVFAASIQYFPSLKKALYKTLSCLKPGGEIHVLDTPFYKPENLERAKRQTLAYYTSFGYPEMADYYFHHCID